jgi:hypothetical protein
MDNSKIQKLQRLGALRDSGALTADEFMAQKAVVLGSGKTKAKVPEFDAQLGAIESLRQAGALSDEEAAQEKTKLLRPKALPGQTDTAASTIIDGFEHEAVPLTTTWTTKPKKQSGSTAIMAGALATILIFGTAAWWFTSRPDSNVESYVVLGTANVRTAPTTEFSSVIDTLSAGEKVEGEWVAGRNNSRWLRLSGEPESYVWEGNLRLEQRR